MLTDVDKIINSTVCVGQFLMLTQPDVFVSIADQLAALLNKRLLNCASTFHALWSPKQCVPSVQLGLKIRLLHT